MSAGRGRAPVRGEAALPPLFARWLAALLPGPIPQENAATCDRCAMLPPDGASAPADGFFFSSATKCCTYLPEIANFLVGRVLADANPAASAGRVTVERRIERGVGVSPLGLHRTPLYTLLYRSSPASFGHAASMRCPHFLADEGGKCGVWKNRESTCATWFCKYDRGSTARAFWQRLHDLLGAAEEAVRLHCLAELGLDTSVWGALFPSNAVATVAAHHGGLSPNDVDGECDAAAYAASWGSWKGRERKLYLACADIASPLAWSDVLRLGGAKVALLARLLGDAYDALVSDAVPERARHRHLEIVRASAEHVDVVGYSPIDPLRVPSELVGVLHCFDGRPTADAIDAVDREHGLRLGSGVVRKLVDFGVLADDG